MDYADKCIRGILNETYLNGDQVGSNLFHFLEKDARDDGWIEQSINWYDNEEAIKLILDQKKDGVIEFKAGYAILPREELDRVIRHPIYRDLFSYERKPILADNQENLPENPYHGNILWRIGMTSKTMKIIAFQLAFHAQFKPRTDV